MKTIWATGLMTLTMLAGSALAAETPKYADAGTHNPGEGNGPLNQAE